MKTKKSEVVQFSLDRLAIALLAGITFFAFPLVGYAMRAPRYAEGTRSTPPSAFLRHKVYTTLRLVAQLKAEPGAQKGYAKIFHISPSQVVSYIERHCATTTLAQTGKFTVYRVTAAGTIYPTLQSVPRGSTVFALSARGGDAPTFISSMGDPMKPYTTAVSVRVVRVAPPTKVITEVSPSQETLVPTDPVQTVVPASSSVYSVPPATEPATTSGNGAAR
jgi:hypothetical protein